jgi:ferric-dicitrate binding protein FerR (iron transport regulator)
MSLPDQDLLELVELCNAWVDGAISNAQQARLASLLEQSAEARAFYVRFMDLSASLHDYSAEMQCEPLPAPVPRHPGRFRLGAGVAAAAAIGIAALAIWQPWADTADGVALEVISATGTPFQPGQRLVRKHLELAQGTLRFRLSSGAVVEVAGPAALELVDPMLLRVASGSVTTDVGDDAKGFVVETLNARVVDLGTRFGVAVDETGDTDVVVFEGEVEIHNAAGGGADQRLADLSEGEALRVDAKRNARRLTSVALRSDSRAMLGGKGSRGSIVTKVTDNITESGCRRFYSILPGGMKEGARPYPAIRKTRWLPLPGQSFPKPLAGADLVGTFAQDRKDANHQIDLEVAGPCTVFVMLDQRAEPPDWLRRDFRDTGLRLRSGPWHPEAAVVSRLPAPAEGRLFLTHTVWRREVAAAGRVELGPPRAQDEPNHHAMYGIAVKAAKKN